MKKEDWITAFKGLLALPIGLAFYILYVHVISAMDGVLTIVLGGAFWIAILASVWWLIVNLKDFVVSIFKENNEVNEKGFKKHF